jgi:hypothetical protein
VWADTVTLRVGDRLLGVRADTYAAAATIRDVFADWLDPTATLEGDSGEPGAAIPWAFSLRLGPDSHAATDDRRRGPKAVPQLRIGRSLLARSRRPDDVVSALDHVLGGLLARQDDTRRWLGLRTFVADDRAVLVDAASPALKADPRLARAGVTELPTWSVAVDGDTVSVPPRLTAADDDGGGAAQTLRLVGLVGLDPCSHAAHTEAAPDPEANTDAVPAESPEEHLAVHHPTNPGALLARFAARHPSSEWFHTVERLVAEGGVRVTTDRADAAEQIRRLLVADEPTD